jgi:hypothetical protein
LAEVVESNHFGACLGLVTAPGSILRPLARFKFFRSTGFTYGVRSSNPLTFAIRTNTTVPLSCLGRSAPGALAKRRLAKTHRRERRP